MYPPNQSMQQPVVVEELGDGAGNTFYRWSNGVITNAQGMPVDEYGRPLQQPQVPQPQAPQQGPMYQQQRPVPPPVPPQPAPRYQTYGATQPRYQQQVPPMASQGGPVYARNASQASQQSVNQSDRYSRYASNVQPQAPQPEVSQPQVQQPPVQGTASQQAPEQGQAEFLHHKDTAEEEIKKTYRPLPGSEYEPLAPLGWVKKIVVEDGRYFEWVLEKDMTEQTDIKKFGLRARPNPEAVDEVVRELRQIKRQDGKDEHSSDTIIIDTSLHDAITSFKARRLKSGNGKHLYIGKTLIVQTDISRVLKSPIDGYEKISNFDTLVELSEYLKSFVSGREDIFGSTDMLRGVDDWVIAMERYMKKRVQGFINNELGIDVSFDLFMLDMPDLVEYIKEEYPDHIYDAFNTFNETFIQKLLFWMDNDDIKENIIDVMADKDDETPEGMVFTGIVRPVTITIADVSSLDLGITETSDKALLLTSKANEVARNLALTVIDKAKEDGFSAAEHLLLTNDGGAFWIYDGAININNVLIRRSSEYGVWAYT